MYQELAMEFNAILGQLGRTIREDWLEALRRKLETVMTVVKEFEEVAANIRGNRELTDIGKNSRFAQAASLSADRLQHVLSDADGYERRIRELQAKTAGPVLPGNEFVRELRACEIRTHYSALDPLKLQAEVLSMGGDTRNHERLATILDAPVPMLDEATTAKAREAMAAATEPETARMIRELRSSHEAVKAAVGSAMRLLRANGLAPDDPVAAMARTGESNGA